MKERKLWTKFETNARCFWQKKNDPLYIIQCSYQVLRYSIAYINENCQAAIIFKQSKYLDFGRTWSKNYIFPCQITGDAHNIIWLGFRKTTEISCLYNCQLEKLTACLYGPGKEGKTKIKIL